MSFIQTIFPDHFILFQPKDIVSGDFYWVSRKKSELIVAVADCTGHGVPGAFMSILGISFLKEIIDKAYYQNTGGILNQLREYVMKALKQTGEENEQKDGIDMTLCRIYTEENKLEFSGAFNPLYVIQNDKLVEIQGDKMPIGIAAYEEKSFKTNIVNLKENDCIYLFSDGFADQFGGPLGKKFKYQPFRDLLMKIHKFPMEKQGEKLTKAFHEWKGDLPQLDDVLVIGFRYHVND
jgi:serine phosphatase RsbU (regulator of sigma subunit)